MSASVQPPSSLRQFLSTIFFFIILTLTHFKTEGNLRRTNELNLYFNKFNTVSSVIPFRYTDMITFSTTASLSHIPNKQCMPIYSGMYTIWCACLTPLKNVMCVFLGCLQSIYCEQKYYKPVFLHAWFAEQIYRINRYFDKIKITIKW